MELKRVQTLIEDSAAAPALIHEGRSMLGLSQLGDALNGDTHDRADVSHGKPLFSQQLDCGTGRIGEFAFCLLCGYCGVLVAVDGFDWESARFDGDSEVFFRLAGHERGGVFDHGFELIQAAGLGAIFVAVYGEVGSPPPVAAGGGGVDVCHFFALLMIAFASISFISRWRGIGSLQVPMVARVWLPPSVRWSVLPLALAILSSRFIRSLRFMTIVYPHRLIQVKPYRQLV